MNVFSVVYSFTASVLPCVYFKISLYAFSGKDKNVHEQSKRNHGEEESCSSG